MLASPYAKHSTTKNNLLKTLQVVLSGTEHWAVIGIIPFVATPVIAQHVSVTVCSWPLDIVILLKHIMDSKLFAAI